MEAHVESRFSPALSDANEEEFVEVKKGPWTAEEDALLMNYVSVYGEGRWNSVARFAGQLTKPRCTIVIFSTAYCTCGYVR